MQFLLGALKHESEDTFAAAYCDGHDFGGSSFDGRGMGRSFSTAGIMAYVKIKRGISNTRYFETRRLNAEEK